jgi:hypothetical protein
VLWDPPWNSVFIDDFTRTLFAMRWAAEPYWAEPGLMWLPGHSWVLGTVLVAVGDAASPLGVAATMNTALVVAAAVVVAATSWRVFRSRAGTLIVLVLALTAPWTHKLALSGLAEPLYVLGAAVGVYGTVLWLERRTLGRLAVGAAGILLGSLVRFEGWTLWAAWLVVVVVLIMRSEDLSGGGKAGSILIAAVPGIVPVVWAAGSLVRYGDPMAFLAIYRSVFQVSGGAQTIVERVFFYPSALVRSDPVLAVIVVASTILAWRRSPLGRPVLLAQIGSVVLLWSSSIVTGSIGFPPERFMHPILLGLTWTIAVLPSIVPAAWSRRQHAAVLLAGVAAVSLAGVARWSERPEEWTYPPDLLELAVGLADLPGPLEVRIPTDLVNEDAPLRVLGAATMEVVSIPPEMVESSVGQGRIVVDRLPERLSLLPRPERVVGRYAVFGDLAAEVGGFRSSCGECTGWSVVDEVGIVTAAPESSPMLALAFTGTEVVPGARVEMTRSFRAHRSSGSLELFALYGRGFNPGRLTVEVLLDDEVVHRRDLATPGGWERVGLPLAGGCLGQRITIAIVASPSVEPGWGWGRASDVLIRSVDLGGVCDPGAISGDDG